MWAIAMWVDWGLVCMSVCVCVCVCLYQIHGECNVVGLGALGACVCLYECVYDCVRVWVCIKFMGNFNVSGLGPRVRASVCLCMYVRVCVY